MHTRQQEGSFGFFIGGVVLAGKVIGVVSESILYEVKSRYYGDATGDKWGIS